MRRPSWLGWVALAATVVGTSLSADDVLAQTCNVASDCPQGFACTPTSIDADGGTEFTCVGGPCASDADCAAGFRCLFGDGTICTVGADGGQICQSNNVCAPQWEVPCTADSQCGPGFTCPEDGGAASNPAATVFTTGVIDCGPSRFDASIPSYATATWVSCADVPEPPLPPFCDGGDGSFQTGCLPPICEAGTMCLSIATRSCSGPASGQTCQSEADCPATWTCSCPFTCTSGGVLPPDAGPAVGAGCTTACIPPNADLGPGYGQCGGGAYGNASSSASGPIDAGSAEQAGGGSAAPTTPSQESAHGGCQAAPGRGSGGSASLLLIALALASARARVRPRARTT
jgi:hypothetical protein